MFVHVYCCAFVFWHGQFQFVANKGLAICVFLPCLFKMPKPSAVTMDDDLGTAGVRQVTVEVCNFF